MSLCVQARSVVIDSSCSQLASLQPRLTRHTGADMVHTPASWEQGTKGMIAASRGEYSTVQYSTVQYSDFEISCAGVRDISQQLRSDIELLVRTAATDLVKGWKKTNADLREQQVTGDTSFFSERLHSGLFHKPLKLLL